MLTFDVWNPFRVRSNTFHSALFDSASLAAESAAVGDGISFPIDIQQVCERSHRHAIIRACRSERRRHRAFCSCSCSSYWSLFFTAPNRSQPKLEHVLLRRAVIRFYLYLFVPPTTPNNAVSGPSAPGWIPIIMHLCSHLWYDSSTKSLWGLLHTENQKHGCSNTGSVDFHETCLTLSFVLCKRHTANGTLLDSRRVESDVC